jgi:hypothetical protein
MVRGNEMPDRIPLGSATHCAQRLVVNRNAMPGENRRKGFGHLAGIFNGGASHVEYDECDTLHASSFS